MDKHGFKNECEHETFHLLVSLGCDEDDLKIAKLAYDVGYQAAVSDNQEDKRKLLKELRRIRNQYKRHLKIVK